jgi:chromate transporter
MSDGEGVIWLLAGNIAILSLMAIGGGFIVVLPELHRQVVDVYGLMSSEDFTNLFAMAQAAPGPNLLVVTLIGFHVGGVAGAVLATIAITAPTCTLVYFATLIWHRFRHARWRRVVQAALVPVSIGLLAASAYLIARQADTNVVAIAVTLGTAVAVSFTRIHPILFLAVGAALGLAGLI